LDGLAGGGVGGDAEDAGCVVEVVLCLHLLCAGGDLPRDLLDLASREVRGVLGDALLKSSGGHGWPPRLPPSAYQRAVVPRPRCRFWSVRPGRWVKHRTARGVASSRWAKKL